jgi:hypothetical protein
MISFSSFPSQALRIKRICSNEQTTKKRLEELKCHLKKRGYTNASINHCFNKASGILKAKTGGSLKILHSSGCFCMVVQRSRTMLDKLLSAGW